MARGTPHPRQRVQPMIVERRCQPDSARDSVAIWRCWGWQKSNATTGADAARWANPQAGRSASRAGASFNKGAQRRSGRRGGAVDEAGPGRYISEWQGQRAGVTAKEATRRAGERL